MNVSLGQRWEGFVEAIVKEGRYASASEVVREGLRLVEEREARLVDLKTFLAPGIADADAGRTLSSSDVFESLRSEHNVMIKDSKA